MLNTSSLIRAIIGFALYLGLVPAILFLAAGTLDWPAAWVYVALLLLLSKIISRVIVRFRNPDLIRERDNFTQTQGVPAKDRLLVLSSVLLGPGILKVTAGLDRRYQWTPPLASVWVSIAGLLMLLGYALAVWAMITNPFFSAVVRIQQDHGQVVVQSGPYARLRSTPGLQRRIAR